MIAAGFHDISEREYHRDPAPAPSLSSSIAKILLDQTPRHAALAHPKLNPQFDAGDRDPTRKAEIGTAAHKVLTGKGAQIVIIDAEDYKTKAAKEARAAAYAAGHAPILKPDIEAAERIHRAVRQRLDAIPECLGALHQGKGEQVMLWQDTGGIWCRGMIDWWQEDTLTAWDIKTTAGGLSDRDIANRITGGWDVQAGLYIRGLTRLLPEQAGRFRWRWIVIEQDEPHEVRVIQADRMTLEMGDRKAAAAINKWSECIVTGDWPGYPAQIATVEYPQWEANRVTERELLMENARNFEPLSSVPRSANDERSELIYADMRVRI